MEVFVEVPVFVDNADLVEIKDGCEVTLHALVRVDVRVEAAVYVGATNPFTRLRKSTLSGGVDPTRPIANNIRDQRIPFYLMDSFSFLGV